MVGRDVGVIVRKGMRSDGIRSRTSSDYSVRAAACAIEILLNRARSCAALDR